MNFRRRIRTEPMGFQIIPIVDVILLLLIFFVSTWTYAHWETELNITVPTAKEVTKTPRTPGEIIINEGAQEFAMEQGDWAVDAVHTLAVSANTATPSLSSVSFTSGTMMVLPRSTNPAG